MDYSSKNIPLPSCREYTKRLLEKVESVIKRMRWKAFFFLNSDTDTDDTSSGDEPNSDDFYGFKSRRAPPQIEEVIGFERDMLDIVENIKFRKVNDDFQTTLTEDVKKINSSKRIFAPADKTKNFYEMDKPKYEKLLSENITQKYKTTDSNTVETLRGMRKHLRETAH
ncbi:hypothetical protein BSL78_09744 [Apostichopus japonicus]|uniref:Uncharacterized protein n=1 Tax=Stichopus japonicus TaxID=307972 RepID=A0A2G8KZI9_STIJA|nr:hypothetical protein BSL78_09744 [Apostichopus japonicus]